ncbi:hypothetical protein QYF36_024653 [Acer negundo]|nr:hypothetical protein QYF36_024653 [Acer negundo]
MHDLLQAMGKEIVRQQSPNGPSKCTRLWRHKDICDVLTKDKGTEKIEAISLNMSSSNARDINLSPRAFAKMKKLRLLNFYVNHSRYNCGNLDLSIDNIKETRGFTVLSQDRRLGILYAILAAGKIIPNIMLHKIKNTGTSKACPLVARIAALIESAQQDWSPDAIRSALVTSTSQIETDGMNVSEEGPALLLTKKQTCSTWVDMSHLPGKQPPPWRTQAQPKYQEEGNNDKKDRQMWDKHELSVQRCSESSI